MKSALIGYTGFVGSNLCAQSGFTDKYNSQNITEIRGKSYDLVICAGAPAVKWHANREPEEDLSNIQYLISNLSEVKADHFLLISTVDVYPKPINVYEDTTIHPEAADAYGKHRYYLEEFVRQKFSSFSIARLPGLFGSGLKKNFIYDLLHQRCLELTHCESTFQFYNLDHLWKDLQIVIQHRLSLINFATEPVTAKDVAKKCFGVNFDNRTSRPPVSYDMKSKYANLFGEDANYFYSADETFDQITRFVNNQTHLNYHEASHI